MFDENETKYRCNIFDMHHHMGDYERLKQRSDVYVLSEERFWTKQGDLMIFMEWEEEEVEG